ncbi:MAG: hypothetical protein HN904_17150 [Victivallales bacterium]|jgi:hypothetical protein|nr:hypothetical protein [Victivallales bacterium]MBT7164510.1 hypothetical protein [Victivallales bacterium]
MTQSLLIVVGLALLLVGGGMSVTSRPISEDEAIQGAAGMTTGSDGQQMYTITGAEAHSALSQRQETNSSNASRKQLGGVLAASGVVLLLAGLAMFGAKLGGREPVVR